MTHWSRDQVWCKIGFHTTEGCIHGIVSNVMRRRSLGHGIESQCYPCLWNASSNQKKKDSLVSSHSAISPQIRLKPIIALNGAITHSLFHRREHHVHLFTQLFDTVSLYWSNIRTPPLSLPPSHFHAISIRQHFIHSSPPDKHLNLNSNAKELTEFSYLGLMHMKVGDLSDNRAAPELDYLVHMKN